MIKPSQKVIVYSGVADNKARKRREEDQERRAAMGMTACGRCGRMYKNPEMSHYADFKNKIRCF